MSGVFSLQMHIFDYRVFGWFQLFVKPLWENTQLLYLDVVDELRGQNVPSVASTAWSVYVHVFGKLCVRGIVCVCVCVCVCVTGKQGLMGR